MAKAMFTGRRFATRALVAAAALAGAGCGESAPPPPTAAEFQKAEAERKEVIRKEYGSPEPAGKARRR
jgi:hypothetical protein